MLNSNYLNRFKILFLLLFLLFNFNLFAVEDSKGSAKNLFLDVMLKEMHLMSKDYMGKESGELENGLLSVNAVELKTITPSQHLFFHGEVKAPELTTIPCTKSGIISCIIGVRNYAFGTLFDEDDNVVIEGTKIATLDQEDIDIRIKSAKARKKLADMSYHYLSKLSAAHEELSKNNIITSFEMEQQRMKLLQGLLTYETTTRDLDETLLTYKTPYIYSDVSGIVTEVMAMPGQKVSEGEPLAKIMEMTPLSIKFECPNELLDISFEKAPVFLYSSTSDKPITSMIELRADDQENAYVQIDNELEVTHQLTSSQKKYRKVFSLYQVMNMLGTDVRYYFLPEYLRRRKEVMGIPLEAIRHDKDGYYVLKGQGININGKDKEIPRVFKVERVPVKLGKVTENLTYELGVTRQSRSIEKNDKLALGDIVIGNADPNIKGGDTVLRVKPTWQFYHGQAVKMKVPILVKKGIYVPEEAIIHQGKGQNYVYLIENDILRLTKVHVVGAYQNYCSIVGKDLVSGKRIVMIDNKKLFDYLYDGRAVKVLKTEEPPVFLENLHAINFKANSGQFKENMPFNLNTVPELTQGAGIQAYQKYFSRGINKNSLSRARADFGL